MQASVEANVSETQEQQTMSSNDVDKLMDEETGQTITRDMSSPRGRLPSESYSVAGEPEELETNRQRFRRYFSIAIVIFSMLVSSIGYSIIFGSIWPYFEKIDGSATESFLGLIIASFSLGQLIFSPLFGIWSNYRPISEPWLFCLTLFIGGNILYVYAEAFDDSEKWILLVSRFIVGSGAANNAIMRAYCSSASREDERNTVMTFLSAMRGLGFILGPCLGLLFQPLGEDGLEWDAIQLYFNLYTGPAYLAILLSIINIALILFFFKESDVHHTKAVVPLSRLFLCCVHRPDKEYNQILEEKRMAASDGQYDCIAAWVAIFIYFIIVGVFASGETIISPYGQDQYAWSNSDASLYVNIIFGVNAVIGVGVFIGTNFIVKWWVPERVMFIGTLFTMALGLIVWIPYGPGHPDVQIVVLKNTTGHRLRPHDSDRGCDFLDQSWCLDIPKINLPQFLLGPTFVIASFCASSLLCQTMFSKVLGPWPQGMMMGFLSGAGSLGSILGPLLLTSVYHEEGPTIGYLVLLGVLLIAVLTSMAFYQRLIPYSLYKQKMKDTGYLPIGTEDSSNYGSINTSVGVSDKSHDAK